MSHAVAHAGRALGRHARRPLTQAVLGTVLGQGLTLLATPLLARLYSPAAIGAYVAVLSLCLILASVASLKFDVAVQRAAPQDLPATVAAALGNTAAATAVATAAAWALRGPLHLEQLWWLVPGYCMVMAGQQVVTAVLLREQDHRAISSNRVAVAALIVAAQVGVGHAAPTAAGLIVADVVARALALGFALRQAGAHAGWRPAGLGSYARIFRQDRALVWFATPAALLNSAVVYALPVLLSVAYPASQVGYVTMTQKVLGLPLALVGQAVGQVFTAQLLRPSAEPGHAHRLFVRQLRVLGALAVLLVALIPVAPALFTALLGPAWAPAGQVYAALACGYAAQLLVNPVSQALNLYRGERTQLLWDGGRLLLIAAVFAGAAWMHAPLMHVLTAYTVVMTVSYVVLLRVIDRVLRGARP
ncbi:O-antigen/teichoic acid export membrane protein [Deinococcus metalli]|uniref:O-antigen/teichoic acid export membrane protein n=1 Tax=Deinococcus metalli TaxID=1141878 RepID=A0A7W8KED6_9DEIO|nr:oligosaccharide flippase family protein [Deinococcus metalli]MBB5376637.1 O-antigen/teichoic acid export membrane protein [Deinococcus metalli]GHF42604.1 translocase [Deinococcus metalli]